jgi:hypothetical protein
LGHAGPVTATPLTVRATHTRAHRGYEPARWPSISVKVVGLQAIHVIDGAARRRAEFGFSRQNGT